jgi:hypothetical protein
MKTVKQRGDLDHLFMYVLVALAAFIAGLILGGAGNPPPHGSRIDWPKPSETRPRQILP